jgi:type IV pilus assembly protein PilN
MIRINLLPQAKRQPAGAAGVQVWAYVYLSASVVWCLALAFVYFSLSSDLDQARAQNADLERQIAKVKAESGNLEALQKELDKSKQLEGVIQGLLAARQGPARVLLELSAILSPGRGPTVDPRKLEEAQQGGGPGFSPGWDTRRLWLTEFLEEQRKCQIRGVARNNEDIAEFLRRLSLSQLFDDVVLVRTGAGSTPGHVDFFLKCKVRY